MTSDERKAKRRLMTLHRKGRLRKGDTETTYADNNGVEYPNRASAKLSSFLNIAIGCFFRGFPVAVKWLPYNAWAFYPFFFVRKGLRLNVSDIITTLNHERIHVVQQRDIHVTFSLPYIVVLAVMEFSGIIGNVLPYLAMVPFIPTLLYGLDFIRVVATTDISGMGFSDIRKLTCFEKEAIENGGDQTFLFSRKFWNVLKYMRR